jgi:hypothetical protein
MKQHHGMERPQVVVGSQTDRGEFGLTVIYGVRAWWERAFIVQAY